MEMRQRVQWIGRMVLLAFILASAAFLSAITAMRFAIQGREVVMPAIAGKSEQEARATLQGRGLFLKVEDRIYSMQGVDTVVRQSPPSGVHVKSGQFAHVVLSMGPQKVTIPAIVDKSLRAARIEILRDGLQIGEVSSFRLPNTPEDVVLQQDPLPGSTAASSPQVNMLVALGRGSSAFAMPDLAGLTLLEAQNRLLAGGLKIGKVTLLPLTGSPHATVTSQLPVAGSRVESGAPVELQVAE
jgi:eukaryotic-like serine/threonine-protein kinase